MDETVEIMKRLWTEEEVTHKGKHFELRERRVLPRSYQKPHPPSSPPATSLRLWPW
jgi:alkanesulfonate monooxygenase SsuD/methylene tetrahydromethanopterin reductase-like flavin-dependent oxidoreductase (luciferase family)